MRSTARRRLPRLLGVLLCVLAAAGCFSLDEMEELRSRIVDAGYTDVGVGHVVDISGFDTVDVRANKPSATDEGTDIARIVWHTYPDEVDGVVVTLNGVSRSATGEEMLRAFGSRQLESNPDEDTDLGDILRPVVIVVLILVVVFKVLRFLRRIGRR